MEAGRTPSITPPFAETDWSGFRELLGNGYLRPGIQKDAVDEIVPESIAEPAGARELAATLKMASASGLSVIPRGCGSKLAWGNPPRAADLVLSTRRLNRVLEHAWGDMTATVEAGCVFADVQRVLAEHGQRLALDPLWPERSTIGGIVAANDSGALRTRFGSVRDLIIGVTRALPDGTLAKSGGKVVKNVAGYDLAKLATGSLGTLGVITQAIFRLHPIPGCIRSASIATPSSTSMQAAILSVLDSQLAPSAVQVRAADSGTPSVDVLFEGTSAGCDAQFQQFERIVSPCSITGSDASVWATRETFFEVSANTAVCKVTLLPTGFARISDHLNHLSQALQFSWAFVVQAVGVGLLQIRTDSISRLRDIVLDLRSLVEAGSGSLVILQCPRELKSTVSVWGDPGDALPLMKNIKAQFDPAAVLNPGRFVGSI